MHLPDMARWSPVRMRRISRRSQEESWACAFGERCCGIIGCAAVVNGLEQVQHDEYLCLELVPSRVALFKSVPISRVLMYDDHAASEAEQNNTGE